MLAVALLLCVWSPASAAAAPSRVIDGNGNKLLDDLDKAIAGKSSSDRVEVIALFEGGRSGEQADAARRAIGSFKTLYEYRTISAVGADMTVAQVQALARRTETVHVQHNAKVPLAMQHARAGFGVDKATLDFSVEGNNEGGSCPDARQYCADDTVVAVLDTGIAQGHVDLDGGKVLRSIDCAVGEGDPCWSGGGVDLDGHGTHVASIVAGEGDGNTANRGVAPGAALVNVKITSASSGTVLWMDKGVEWTIQNKDQYGIEALNLSSGTTSSANGTESTSRLINRAAAAGIVPFVAAGNSGASGTKTIGSPAAAKFAVTVGAMTDLESSGGYATLGFNLWYSSSRGPTADGRTKPDIGAPGVGIYAADGTGTNGYISKTGTSMASPFAAGVGALMLDANSSLRSSGSACASDDTSTECNDGVIDSTMSVPVKDRMTAAAIDWGPSGTDDYYGAGRLDAYAAVDSASATDGTGGPAVPVHTFTQGSLSAGAVVKHQIAVTGTDFPIAVTLVAPTAVRYSTKDGPVVDPDFEIILLDPSGTQVASSPLTNTAQETLGFRPTVTGTYTVQVRSVSGSGPYWFDASYQGDPPPPPPDAPAALTATAASSTRVDLSWSDVGTESSYRIERSPDGSTNWTAVGSVGQDVTTYSDTGLTHNTTYHYRVRAVNAGGESSPSNVAQASTFADTTAPTTPTGLVASGQKGAIKLTWNASSDSSGGTGVAGYEVWRSTSSTGTYTKIATTTTTTYTNSGLKRGSVYYYYLIAYDTAGNRSTRSSTVSAKVL